ncbi:MAG: bifunctional demethylmenaquinone methyltransferase/2-methoxy-6-polyprenyl-1,4-benzoquinol methylase UbiE [Leptolyngbyaceae cyanobacterium SM1_3_5]|nr:bifunctional demethylmenaquinone methyltransferase/2-methoxy-6-polyprenyl-1,4-benzoquinol methylase UbiE [Leptolyngbyaceae cyanobacterium SM1_3_5]
MNAPPAPEIQAIFDRIAPVYDQLNDRLSFGQHRVWKQMAVKWSQAAPGMACVDVCCGSGDLVRLLAKRVGTSGKVVGVDFSPAQLEVARSRFPGFGTGAIDWIEGDALGLPFPDAQFEAATMGYGLRNVTDILTSLKELRRVLKSDATAAILDFHRPESPAVRTFQQWYLQTIVVPTAQQLGLTDEYAYISPSLDRFPVGAEQVELALQAGFAQAKHYAIAGGIMGVLVATV